MTEYDRSTCACFTGHRRIVKNELLRVSGQIAEKVRHLADMGIIHYYAGGALGFDMAAAVTVINLRSMVPELTLTVAIPCHDYDIKWNNMDREQYKRIIARADGVEYISDVYSKGCMAKRNRYMVDRSRACIYYLNERSGGTFSTAKYAKSKGLYMLSLGGISV